MPLGSHIFNRNVNLQQCGGDSCDDGDGGGGGTTVALMVLVQR